MIIRGKMRNTVYFKDFLTDDHTASFESAMAYLREHPYTTLVVEPGTYNITSELARKTMNDVITGALGDDPLAVIFKPDFPYTRGICFAGQKGTRVEAYGVTLMVDGFMEPVSVRDCEDVEILGLTVDHKRKPYAKAVFKDVGELTPDGMRWCTLEFDPACPMYAETPTWLKTRYFDVENYRSIHTYVHDYEQVDTFHRRALMGNAEELRDGIEYYSAHTEHFRPAILIENAVNVHLTDVTIHSQPGMGVVGNRSENVVFTRLSIVPSAGHHMSTNTDATHFTSMKGLLRLENCVFEGQGDDFINVHNYYQEIIERVADNEVYIQEKTPDGTHAQSLEYPDAGDTLELTCKSTMALVDSFKVISVETFPEKWCCKVTLDRALPENTEGLLLSNVTRLPRLEVVGCNARSHKARGVMLKTRDALIEGNSFHDIEASAIFIAPEAEWYEGVSPADVTVRRNRIVMCAPEGEVKGAIVVLADTENPEGQCIRNIVIEDNVIDCPTTDYGIYVRNVDGVRVARNRIVSGLDAVKIERCTNVSVEQ